MQVFVKIQVLAQLPVVLQKKSFHATTNPQFSEIIPDDMAVIGILNVFVGLLCDLY